MASSNPQGGAKNILSQIGSGIAQIIRNMAKALSNLRNRGK